MNPPVPGRMRAALAGIAGAALLMLLARGVIDHAPHYDELLHLLAARGLMHTGQPVIADGLYERAELYTRAVAWSLAHFGDTPIAARLPALAGAVLLALLVAGWLARRAGTPAGVTAGILLAIAPATLDVAVFARFYTFHALVVTLLGILAFEASRSGRSIALRGAAATAALALAALGWHFQETTVIALGAILLALVAALIERHWQAVRAFVSRRPAVVASALLLVLGGGMMALWAAGLLHTFGTTALWAARDAGRFQFYLIGLRDELPLLWPLLPAAAVLALSSAERRTLALFATVIVAAALLVHSIAAQKTMRYVYYVVPWMSVLWALGLTSLYQAARLRGATALLAMSIALAGSAALSREGARALNLLAGRASSVDARPFRDEPDWAPVVPELAPRVTAADHVITSNSMKALYYFGRYDLELNATIVPETDSRGEFGRDERTGRRVIGTAASVERALVEPGATLVLIESSKIGRASGVDAAAMRVIEATCRSLPLQGGAEPQAWWCGPSPR